MGTFTLSPGFVMPKENDKDAEIPENAISFQCNLRAMSDEALINYIVQQTRKMKSLAAADLDSYLVLGKQFLNIGKPFIIEGMGMLTKNQQGDLEFIKGHSFNTKMETSAPALKEKAENPEISFATEGKPAGSKKGLLITALIIGLGLIGTTAWYFFSSKNTVENTVAVPAIQPDTAQTITITKSDTATFKGIDSTLEQEEYNFKVVFLVTRDSAAANARMVVLTTRGHKIIMYKKDSVNYRLAEPFKLPLSDTTRIKDSLNSFYYLGKAFIELN
jgi:hypothetical protein